MRFKGNIREVTIELIDGDPLSAIGNMLPQRNKFGELGKAMAFTILTHLTMGTLGQVDVPWGSSSAFGIPHYRKIREVQEERILDKGKKSILTYNLPNKYQN